MLQNSPAIRVFTLNFCQYLGISDMAFSDVIACQSNKEPIRTIDIIKSVVKHSKIFHPSHNALLGITTIPDAHLHSCISGKLHHTFHTRVASGFGIKVGFLVYNRRNKPPVECVLICRFLNDAFVFGKSCFQASLIFFEIKGFKEVTFLTVISIYRYLTVI